MAKIPDSEIQLAIQLFNNGMSITKIAQQLHRDRKSLSDRMKQEGVVITQHCNKKQVNSNFFDNWTEKSAYWLGFIFADGHLSDRDYLEITIKDKEHLEKFKADINSEHKISTKHVNGFDYYKIILRDKHLAEQLRYLGVSHNKTYGWDLPSIPDEYMNHFIRGLFDGDGTFTHSKGAYSFRIVSYNRNILEELIEIIKNFVPEVNGHIRIYQYKERVPELNIGDNKTLKVFLEWLYNNSTVYLDRKYEKCSRLPSQDETDNNLEMISAELNGDAAKQETAGNPSPKDAGDSIQAQRIDSDPLPAE